MIAEVILSTTPTTWFFTDEQVDKWLESEDPPTSAPLNQTAVHLVIYRSQQQKKKDKRDGKVARDRNAVRVRVDPDGTNGIAHYCY